MTPTDFPTPPIVRSHSLMRVWAGPYPRLDDPPHTRYLDTFTANWRNRRLACGLTVALVLASAPAPAHDFWTTNVPVPPWVKATCCGPADVHRLNPSAVHIGPDGYHIDGIDTVIPISRALPSPTGEYWAFFNEVSLPNAVIYCFFAPLNGV